MPSPISQVSTPKPPLARIYGYTHVQPDGNRFMSGRGSLPDTQPIDIPLSGKPRWVVGTATEQGALWIVVAEDDTAQAFQVADDGEVVELERVPFGIPPLLVDEGLSRLLEAPANASPFTHPIPLGDRMAFIDADGDLVLWDDGEVARLPLNALPDARLLKDENERLLLLTGATNRYQHGVLGDAIEAASITLVETSPTLRVALVIDIPGETVVEGIAPIWADLDGDGTREIVVTLSNAL